jgi:hypothetical protein
VSTARKRRQSKKGKLETPGLTAKEVEKIRAKIVEPNNVLGVYRGKFVEREEFDEYFENADEIFRFFEDEIVLGAIIDYLGKTVFFITLSTNPGDPITRLTVWRARIE